MTTHLIGLDLGQSMDFSALAVVHRAWTWPGHVQGEPFDPRSSQLRHEIPFLQRWPLGTPYPAIVQSVVERFHKVQEDRECDQVTLVIDETGVGRPVLDMLRRERIRTVGITITGGQSVSQPHGGDEMSVPKRDLASALIVAAQSGFLKVSSELYLANDFEEELAAFGYELNRQTGRASYESQSPDVHDDLVMAAAIALWYSTSRLPQRFSGGGGFGATVEGMDYNPISREALGLKEKKW
jgi:hypothetical protein